MLTLAEIQAGWDQAARENAQANILSIPGLTHDEFMATGRREIRFVLADVASRGIKHGWERAFDFGCGIGRLSVALAERFDHVIGFDISEEMVSRAVSHPKVDYIAAKAFKGREHFDFVYSNITLQHMPSGIQMDYVLQLIPLLRANGVAVFEIPDGPGIEKGHLSMYGTDTNLVTEWIKDAGGKLVSITSTDSAGAMASYRYTVVK